MPTIALLNGHTYAGGLFTALHHDYRILNPSKGFLCLNEVHFGSTIPMPMINIVKTKIGSRSTVRSMLTEGKRFDAKEALAQGIIDATGGLEEVLAFIHERNLLKLSQTGSYGAIKEDTYCEQLACLESPEQNTRWRERMEEFNHNLSQDRAKKVEAWAAAHKRAKI